MDADQTRVPYSGAYLPPEIVDAIQGEHYPADAVAKAWPIIAARALHEAAADLRWLAQSRAEYADADAREQGRMARLLADILDGKNDGNGWLPSWRWTEWATRRRHAGRLRTPDAGVGGGERG